MIRACHPRRTRRLAGAGPTRFHVNRLGQQHASDKLGAELDFKHHHVRYQGNHDTLG